MQEVNGTKQRILDSARELIFSRSYADVGVADICTHAGVKKGSFYHFYPSKQALAIAALDAHFFAMYEHVYSVAFAEDISPLARIKRLADIVYEAQKQIKLRTGNVQGCPFGNLSNELSSQNEVIRKGVQKSFSKMESFLRMALYEAQEIRELGPDVDIAATAQSMLAFLEGVLLLAKNQNDAELIRQLLPGMSFIRVTRG